MMRQRRAIIDGSYNEFVLWFLTTRYGGVAQSPAWVVEALRFAGLELK